jgi:hypothetical protein
LTNNGSLCPKSGGEKNWNIFDSYLVKNFEYEIEIKEDGGIPGLRRARKHFVGIL